MRGTSRGTLLLVGLLLFWAAAGHAFYRVDAMQDRPAHRLMADLIRHKIAMATAVDGPRVLIAGGSNAYYGIDANVVARQLDVEVMNIALPFGAHHHRIALDLVERQVRAGDVVVYSAGEFWDSERKPNRRAVELDAHLADEGLAGYRRKFTRTPLPWRALPETGPLVLAIADGTASNDGRSWVEDTDARGNFTACTDAPVVRPRSYRKDGIDTDLADALAAAAGRVSRLGAKLVVSLPWLLIRERDRVRWTGFRNDFVRGYEPAVPVLASNPSLLLRTDRRDFCDSPLHLSTDATRRRSNALAVALRPYVEASRQGS